MNPTTRPTTPTRPNPDGSRTIKVKACCNRCGHQLGDVTEQEIWATMGGVAVSPAAAARALAAPSPDDPEPDPPEEVARLEQHYAEDLATQRGLVLERRGIRYTSYGDGEVVALDTNSTAEDDRWAECPRCNLALAEALAREHQLTELILDYLEADLLHEQAKITDATDFHSTPSYLLAPLASAARTALAAAVHHEPAPTSCTTCGGRLPSHTLDCPGPPWPARVPRSTVR